MKRVSSIPRVSTDWLKCCICQDPVQTRSEKVEKLAEQLLAFWENDLLPFSANLLSDDMVDGKPNFKECMLKNNAVYHHNCYSKFTSFKLNVKIASRNRKLEKERLTSRPSTSTSLRSQLQPSRSMIICYICGEEDTLDNLHAAGAKYATKKRLDYSYIEEQTEQWREMARVVGRDDLMKRLLIGDLGANSIFYHLKRYSELKRSYEKALSENESSHITDVNRIVASGVDKVVGYIYDTEAESPGTVFYINELETIFLNYLSEHGICRESHTTHFAEKLTKALPELKLNKAGKRWVCCFSDTIGYLITESMSNSGEFIRNLRSVIAPIRQDIMQKKNNFTDAVDNKSQQKAVSLLLLTMSSMLIDGHCDIENNCSQVALTVAQLLSFNIRSKNSTTAIRRHRKYKENPVTMYKSL